MIQKFARIAFFIASVGLIYVSLIPGSNMPGNIHDKILHLVAYGFVGLFAVFGYREVSQRLKWLGGLVVLGILLEFGQRIAPGRSFEFLDMIANTLGVCIAAGIGFLTDRKFSLTS